MRRSSIEAGSSELPGHPPADTNEIGRPRRPSLWQGGRCPRQAAPRDGTGPGLLQYRATPSRAHGSGAAKWLPLIVRHARPRGMRPCGSLLPGRRSLFWMGPRRLNELDMSCAPPQRRSRRGCAPSCLRRAEPGRRSHPGRRCRRSRWGCTCRGATRSPAPWQRSWRPTRALSSCDRRDATRRRRVRTPVQQRRQTAAAVKSASACWRCACRPARSSPLGEQGADRGSTSTVLISGSSGRWILSNADEHDHGRACPEAPGLGEQPRSQTGIQGPIDVPAQRGGIEPRQSAPAVEQCVGRQRRLRQRAQLGNWLSRAREIVICSPRAARSTTSPPRLRSSRMVTSAM